MEPEPASRRNPVWRMTTFALACVGTIFTFNTAKSDILDLSLGQGDSFVLISQAEYDLFTKDGMGSAETAWKKFIPVINAPLIHLLSPEDLSIPLASPIDLEVRFEALAGAQVDPESIRFKYRKVGGWWNITDRILRHATPSADGLNVQGAKLPSGKHRIMLEIKDTGGLKNQYVYAFKIKKPQR